MTTTMDPAERALVLRHLDNWRDAGPILARRRRDAVAALGEAEGARIAMDLAASLDLLPSRTRRRGSGLVEQQRLFALLRDS